jgi:hypothetical protein
MISDKAPNGLGLDAAGGAADGRQQGGRVSVKFRRGPIIAIVAGALLWAGIIAAWWLL